MTGGRSGDMTALPDLPAPDPPAPDRVLIRFEPDGARPKEVRVPGGATLFDAASWNGIAVDSTCGGHGTCRKCLMRVVEGDVAVSRLDPRAFSPDELRAGWRLACRARAEQDLRVEVPPLVTRPKAATVGVGRQVILRPALQKRCVTLPEATLSDQRTDVERLRDALPDLELRVDLPAIRDLSRAMRASSDSGDGVEQPVTAVVVDDVLVAVEPGDTTARLFGIAFDLGTTTVVATLLDLATGTPVAVASLLNPQQPYGADVITRISATMMDPDSLGRLTALAHEGLDQLVGEVCADGGVERREVYEIALAGNATMVHLALGIPPEPLGVAPFVMASR
ncbi:MAG TPA: 2Fe-2S iron-sulfur cluster-binding protein, partial [Nannocystis sp.]